MNMYRYLYCLLLLVLCTAACSPPDTAEVYLPATYPLDLHRQSPGPDLVAWGDDLDTAMARSAESCRPVLTLYHGPDRGPDAAALTSQPLLAEAAEDLFIPLALPADDANGETACRIFDAGGRDLVAPATVMEAPGELVRMMIGALEDGDGEAPQWLRLVMAETGAGERRMLSLAMFCYWEGEAKLGDLDGVLATRSGMMGEDEVVEVVYDPAVLGFETLVESARKMDCASAVYAHTAGDLALARDLVGDLAKPAPERARMVADDQVKYALKRTPMARLPLTPLQAARINADIRLGPDPRRWLSPRQLKLLDAVKQLLEEDPDALNDFSPPEKPGLLADYQSRLEDHLVNSK